MHLGDSSLYNEGNMGRPTGRPWHHGLCYTGSDLPFTVGSRLVVRETVKQRIAQVQMARWSVTLHGCVILRHTLGTEMLGKGASFEADDMVD